MKGVPADYNERYTLTNHMFLANPSRIRNTLNQPSHPHTYRMIINKRIVRDWHPK